MDDHWYLLKVGKYSNKNQACTTNTEISSFYIKIPNKYLVLIVWLFNDVYIEIHFRIWDRVSISIYEYGNKCHLVGNHFLQQSQRVVTNSYQTSTQKVNDVIPLHETPFCVHWNGKDIFGALPLHNIYCTQWIVKIQDDDSKYNSHSPF